MKNSIIKAIRDAGRPLTAQEIATAIKEPTAATRVSARTLVSTKVLKCLEAVGAVTHYALPGMADVPPSQTAPQRLPIDQLIAEAKNTPDKVPMRKGQIYLPALEILRTRGYTWKDCQKWLAERGHRVSACTLSKADLKLRKNAGEAAHK